MIQRGSGKIIFTASLLTFQGGITVPGYAASKGGHRASSPKPLRTSGRAKGVQVNAIAPDYVATDNTTALRNDPIRNRCDSGAHSGRTMGRAGRLRGRGGFLGIAGIGLCQRTVLTIDGGWMGR